MVKKPKENPMIVRRALVVALSIAVLIEALVLVGGAIVPGGNNLASVLPGVVAVLTNDARAREQIASLKENEVLARGAQMKADDMAARGYFSHTDPDGNPPWKWFNEAGYRYEYAGENLAVNFSESEDVVDAWLNSPTHRANILKAQFTEIGIGVAKGIYKGKETTFVVQFFGNPAETAAAAPAPVDYVASPAPLPETPPEQILVSSEVLGTSTSGIEEFVEAPVEGNKLTLYILFGALLLTLSIGLAFGRRFPKLWPTIAILLSLVILLGFVSVHEEELFGTPQSQG